jgi:hypothetical protein
MALPFFGRGRMIAAVRLDLMDASKPGGRTGAERPQPGMLLKHGCRDGRIR